MPDRPPPAAPAVRLVVGLIGCELARVGGDAGPGDLDCEPSDEAERGRRELTAAGVMGAIPYE